MRTLILTGLAALALAVAADGAQARARVHGGHARPHAEALPHTYPQAGIRPAAPAPALAVRERSGVRPTYVLLPGVGGGLDRAVPALVPPNPAPAPSPAPSPDPAQGAAPQPVAPQPVARPAVAPVPAPGPAKAVAEAGPWCRSGRVVGTGTGFCLVN